MASLGRITYCSAGWNIPCLTFVTLIVLYNVCITAEADGYQNFTVGDARGWAPSTTKDLYQKWAQGKNFSLGDFLLFNYPNETHDVIVTQNETVYKNCEWLDNDDIDVWGKTDEAASSSAVPLLKTGVTYFLCGIEPISEHCENGMKFSINVSSGLGLPPSLLATPPPPPLVDGTGTAAAGQAPPTSNPPSSSSHFISACIHFVLLIQAISAAIVIIL